MFRLQRLARSVCKSGVLCDGPDAAIEPGPLPPQMSRLVFTGTGNSTGTPRPGCLLSMKDDPQCRISLLAMQGSPHRNRNYRGNPGMLIQYAALDGTTHNIQIDVGKTFKESVIRWYPLFGVPWVDAVILTHDHADAIMGLDDLRTVQRLPQGADMTQLAGARDDFTALPVFVHERHMPTLRRVFAYLMPQKVASANAVARFTAKLDWIELTDFQTFVCPGGFEVTTVPVQHGRDYICQAFLFGKKDRVAYLSDVSAVPDSTMKVLEAEPISLLVLDCLYETPHNTHFGMQQALDLIKHLRPKKTLLVGMSDAFEHHETNARLRLLAQNESLDVQLAHDGQYVDLVL